MFFRSACGTTRSTVSAGAAGDQIAKASMTASRRKRSFVISRSPPANFRSYAAGGAGRLRPRHERQFFDMRSEEHTSELQSLMRISYAVFCLKKNNTRN